MGQFQPNLRAAFADGAATILEPFGQNGKPFVHNEKNCSSGMEENLVELHIGCTFKKVEALNGNISPTAASSFNLQDPWIFYDT